MSYKPRRTGFLALALVVVLAGAGCSRPKVAPPPPTATVTTSCASAPPDARTARVLERTNADRAAYGLPALRWDGRLYCLARDWSRRMASTLTFAHQDLAAVIRSSAYSTYRTLGENILRGPAELTGDQMEDAWMGSSSHRANILSGGYTSFAIATSVGSDGRVYAAAEFGG